MRTFEYLLLALVAVVLAAGVAYAAKSVIDPAMNRATATFELANG
jgi:uncharacterized protein (UPF0333 family)